jgi:hypothetical protein
MISYSAWRSRRTAQLWVQTHLWRRRPNQYETRPIPRPHIFALTLSECPRIPTVVRHMGDLNICSTFSAIFSLSIYMFTYSTMYILNVKTAPLVLNTYYNVNPPSMLWTQNRERTVCNHTVHWAKNKHMFRFCVMRMRTEYILLSKWGMYH